MNPHYSGHPDVDHGGSISPNQPPGLGQNLGGRTGPAPVPVPVSNLTKTLLELLNHVAYTNPSDSFDPSAHPPPSDPYSLSLGQNSFGSQHSTVSYNSQFGAHPSSLPYFPGPLLLSVPHSVGHRMPPALMARRDSTQFVPQSHYPPHIVSGLYSKPMSVPVPTTTPSHYSYTGSAHANGFIPQPLQPTTTVLMTGAIPSVNSEYSSSRDKTYTPSKRISPEDSSVTLPAYTLYADFLEGLNMEEGQDTHVNIVDYPVQDLIKMLACLLTKIIEANDKLHPNHFDKTIAIRQRLKLQQRDRNLAKLHHFSDHESRHEKSSELMPHTRSQSVAIVEVNDAVTPTELETSTDYLDEVPEDEIKNRYLANVLAFHGTNVPGISLQDYLTRVLKYCPVTNEVFLLLLVYFDRIAKKANQLQSQGNANGMDVDLEETAVGKEDEQLFVMDLYNIHRLIIAGITVLSKFFLDIFYKNLRYAKVGGLPLEELNYLELQFLLMLDFKLMVSVEEMQNYGDLLRRFYQREQAS